MTTLPMALTEAVRAFKRQYLAHMLRVHHGNRTQTAKALGTGRPYLSRLIRQLGLSTHHRQVRP